MDYLIDKDFRNTYSSKGSSEGVRKKLNFSDSKTRSIDFHKTGLSKNSSSTRIPTSPSNTYYVHSPYKSPVKKGMGSLPPTYTPRLASRQFSERQHTFNNLMHSLDNYNAADHVLFADSKVKELDMQEKARVLKKLDDDIKETYKEKSKLQGYINWLKQEIKTENAVVYQKERQIDKIANHSRDVKEKIKTEIGKQPTLGKVLKIAKDDVIEISDQIKCLNEKNEQHKKDIDIERAKVTELREEILKIKRTIPAQSKEVNKFRNQNMLQDKILTRLEENIKNHVRASISFSNAVKDTASKGMIC